MEHLVVRFQNHLPYRLEGLNDCSVSFQIPKTERLKTLQFMKKRPQHIIKKGKSSWEVIGIPPPLKQRGGQNTYRAFLSGLKKVLAQVPEHQLSRLPLVELQKIHIGARMTIAGCGWKLLFARLRVSLPSHDNRTCERKWRFMAVRVNSIA